MIFEPDGDHVETRAVTGLADYSFEHPIVVTPDGVVFIPNIVQRVGTFIADWKWGMFPVTENGEIPATKPTFSYFVPDHSGRLWVARPGLGRRLEGCDENAADREAFQRAPCWKDDEIVEVFDVQDGRYLGRVQMPPGGVMHPIVKPYIHAELMVAAIEDEAGTIMVKRYRLVLPGEAGQ